MRTKYHKTAGGVVVDDEGRLLTIERDVDRGGSVVHEIRLPKGHIDPGETPEEAAVREVGEESGYWEVEIVSDLGGLKSEFDYKDKHHVRDERYFLMRLRAAGVRASKPMGREEALFTPLWLDAASAEARLTYPSEAKFVRRARHALAEMETKKGTLS